MHQNWSLNVSSEFSGWTEAVKGHQCLPFSSTWTFPWRAGHSRPGLEKAVGPSSINWHEDGKIYTEENLKTTIKYTWILCFRTYLLEVLLRRYFLHFSIDSSFSPLRNLPCPHQPLPGTPTITEGTMWEEEDERYWRPSSEENYSMIQVKFLKI